MLRIIPVLDIKNGTAVHARGGDRDHYAPLRSIVHEGHDPVELAGAFRERCGYETVYLADLDAIQHGRRNLHLYERICNLPLALWVDAGVRNGDDAGQIIGLGASVVAGLETLQGPNALAELIKRFGPERVIFSLDLRSGTPVVAAENLWHESDPCMIADVAVNCGIEQMIVLDLARVGMNTGLGTLPLIESIRKKHGDLKVIAGGGIAGPQDLASLEIAGVWGALVGSALHDGRIRG